MITIYLADFSHKNHHYRNFPYQVGLVGAWALRELEGKISIELFKSFDELGERVAAKKPDILGVTNYIWNNRLAYLAADLVKKEYPDTVCVMGGPHYDDDTILQKQFLEDRPAVDFYVKHEGEVPFTELVKQLIDVRLDSQALKSEEAQIPNVHYLHHGELIRGETYPKLRELDEIPSPYLTGLLDKFFEQDMGVLLQRTRGCPYHCTFCLEGTEYYNKVGQFSTNRFSSEVEYCAKRMQGKEGRRQTMYIADANFGMFPEDLAVADELTAIQQEYGWPNKLEVCAGKNKNARIAEVFRKINRTSPGIARLGASVQSTDLQVLEKVKRTNISLAGMVANLGGNGEEKDDVESWGEVILGLPGDSFRAHTQTLKDLIDQGIKRIGHYYLTLLPGSEMNSLDDREKHGVKTAFRFGPAWHGKYWWGQKEYQWYEIETHVIANDTLSFEEYLSCLEYDLMVETFYNNHIFDEFFGLLRYLDLSISDYLDGLFAMRADFPSGVDQVFCEYLEARKLLTWDDREKLIEESNNNPDLIDQLQFHENKISMATTKATLFFSHMEELNAMAYRAMVSYLKSVGEYENGISDYLEEAAINSAARKTALVSPEVMERTLHYDFPGLHKKGYVAAPSSFHVPEGITITYKPNQASLVKYARLEQTESDQSLRWRQFLFQPRMDTNDEFCRTMEVR